MGLRWKSNDIRWKSSHVQTIKNPRQLFVTLLTSNRDLMTSLNRPQNEPDWAASACFISERCLFGTVVCIVRSSIKGTGGVDKRLLQASGYWASIQVGVVMVNTLADWISNASSHVNKQALVQCIDTMTTFSTARAQKGQLKALATKS